MIETLGLKLKHRLQFYHFRHAVYPRLSKKYRFLPKSNQTNILFICRCGWLNWWMREVKWKTRIRSLVKCSWRDHDFDEASTVEVGPIYEQEGVFKSAIDEGEGIVIGNTRQCRRCYKVEDV